MNDFYTINELNEKSLNVILSPKLQLIELTNIRNFLHFPSVDLPLDLVIDLYLTATIFVNYRCINYTV